MSSSFALWWRRAFSSHSPPPEAILSLFMYTWPTIAHSFRDMSSHPWKARICITNLSQDFSSSFLGDLCRNFLLHYIPGTTDLADCDSSPISDLLFHPMSIPASWPKYYSHFSCTHASTASTKTNQITREVNVWAYMSLPAAYRKCLCCCILSQLFMRNVPPHLLWWSCGEFADHISEWQSS